MSGSIVYEGQRITRNSFIDRGADEVLEAIWANTAIAMSTFSGVGVHSGWEWLWSYWCRGMEISCNGGGIRVGARTDRSCSTWSNCSGGIGVSRGHHSHCEQLLEAQAWCERAERF